MDMGTPISEIEMDMSRGIRECSKLSDETVRAGYIVEYDLWGERIETLVMLRPTESKKIYTGTGASSFNIYIRQKTLDEIETIEGHGEITVESDAFLGAMVGAAMGARDKK